MADLCRRYLEEHASKNRLRRSARCRHDRPAFVLPAFAHKKVAELTFSDCDGLHRKISRRGTKHRANRVIALLSKTFNLSIRWGWRSTIPARASSAILRASAAVTCADELARLTEALAAYPDQQAANIVRLLLLTGAAAARCSAPGGRISISRRASGQAGATTKQRTEHRVPLSAPAIELLVKLRAGADDDAEFVFPGRRGGHRDYLKRPWPRICKAAQLTGVRVHDLRHSYASLLATAGFSLPMIGALLGHSQPSTTAAKPSARRSAQDGDRSRRRHHRRQAKRRGAEAT